MSENLERKDLSLNDRRWRSKPTKYISTRPIFKEEYPKLIEAMMEDGLIAIITAEGIRWYHGDYGVSKKVVGGVWNITSSQMKKIDYYIYSHDPFGAPFRSENES